MGLFDGYFDNSSYNPQGSLIDRLLAGLQTQSAYQPTGTGFPSSPMGAQASIPPQQQNTPIAVGNDYQMPRIGGGFVTPDGSLLPQNEDEAAAGVLPGGLKPAQAQPAQPVSAPSVPTYQSPGGLTSALHGAVANMQGGPLGMIGGAIAGAVGMGQGTPQQQLQAQVMQTYKSLIAAGVPPEKAQLAAISPEAAKSILPDYLGSDNYSIVQTGENDLGRKTYQKFNKKTGELQPIAGSAAPNAGDGLGDMSKTGADYLATLPRDQANIVKGMVDGTIAPPSSFALAKPYWTKMISAAQAYDPTFDATKWGGRVAGVKDFSAGKSAEMVRSANQTLHHVGQLLDSMDSLNNGSYPLINRAGNAIAEATGSGTQGAFRTNAHAVAEELSKVFKGSNLSDTEIKSWESNLNENMSPEQQRAQVAKLRDLLQGSLQALEEKRLSSIGPMAAEKQGPLIKEEGQRVLQRIQDWINKGTGAAQGTSAAQTKTGVKWSVVQ